MCYLRCPSCPVLPILFYKLGYMPLHAACCSCYYYVLQSGHDTWRDVSLDCPTRPLLRQTFIWIIPCINVSTSVRNASSTSISLFFYFHSPSSRFSAIPPSCCLACKSSMPSSYPPQPFIFQPLIPTNQNPLFDSHVTSQGPPV